MRPNRGTLFENRARIESTFDKAERVFNSAELSAFVEQHRESWKLAASMRWRQVADYFTDAGQLIPVDLRRTAAGKDLAGPRVIHRYAWGQPSPFAVALSIRPNSYLTHASAIFLRGLSHVLPEVVYVNKEQTPKPAPQGHLTQESLNRAFSNAPRISHYVFAFGEHRIVLLSGKASGHLEVDDLTYSKETLPTTKVERTLIDITVRPTYAGGVSEVLRAYRSGRDVASVPLLLKTLKRLGYVYPFEQAVGFYLERAGYAQAALAQIDRSAFRFDFYLSNQIKNRAYSKRWRLFYPESL